MKPLPTFNSSFLNDVCEQVRRRSKALKHSGTLTWETDLTDDFEWITFNFDPVVGNYCVFQFDEDNHVSVFIREKARSNRGKILFFKEDLTIVPRPREIVGAIEETIYYSDNIKLEAQRNIVSQAWSAIEVRVVK